MSDERQQHERGTTSNAWIIIAIVIIILLIAVGIWATVTATVSDAGRLVYTEKADGTLEVTEIKSTYKDGWFCRKSLTVPEKVDGKKVTSIAHIDSAKLQKIVLPESVTSIGSEAFSGNSSLSEIYLGNSVRTIGDGAWKQCSSLHTVSFPDSVETVGTKVFEGAPIDYNQYGGLNYIGNAENPYLVLMGVGDTFIPETSVHENTKIAAKACFEATKGGDGQTIGNQIGKINTGKLDILTERMFMGCDRLEEVVTAASELGANCFDQCTGLKHIEVSDSLTKLQNRCLAETGLTELSLPASVLSFAENAVQGSVSLAVLQLNNDKYLSAYNILYDKDLTNIIAVAEGMPKATVLSGLKPTSGNQNCLDKLSACGKLTSVAIENGGTVEFSATSGGVQHDYSYFAEEGILYKGDNYTKSGENVREVTLHTVPRMIESIVLSDDLTSLSADVFSACANLQSIAIENGANISVTQGTSNRHDYTYFAEGGLLYRTDKYGKEGEQTEETAIFAVPRAIESIVLSDKITSIAANTFSACKELASVVISDTVTEIGAGAFSGCEKLTQATFRETNGWTVAKDDKGTEEQALTGLGDPARAAEYLIKDYVKYIWKRG